MRPFKQSKTYIISNDNLTGTSTTQGVTMFSAEIKQQVLSEYLQGTSPLLLMKKYDIKGSATIYKWLT